MADDKKFAQTERFSGEVNKCIDCGNCTFWCPVYEVRPQESSVARGKNTLLRALLKGEIEINEELADALNTCTLCMACTEHCLVDCDVKSVVIAARSDKARVQGLDRKLVSSSGYYRTGRFLAAQKDSAQGEASEERFLRQSVPLVNSPPEGIKTRMSAGAW